MEFALELGINYIFKGKWMFFTKKHPFYFGSYNNICTFAVPKVIYTCNWSGVSTNYRK
jgi:hypothetical protein